jgi:hypothetical protein
VHRDDLASLLGKVEADEVGDVFFVIDDQNAAHAGGAT